MDFENILPSFQLNCAVHFFKLRILSTEKKQIYSRSSRKRHCVQPRQHPAHYHALEVTERAYNILPSWICDICRCPNKPDEM